MPSSEQRRFGALPDRARLGSVVLSAPSPGERTETSNGWLRGRRERRQVGSSVRWSWIESACTLLTGKIELE